MTEWRRGWDSNSHDLTVNDLVSDNRTPWLSLPTKVVYTSAAPRARLYQLQPIGLGTAHILTVNLLFAHELIPKIQTELFHEWIADVMGLPEHQRHEAINRRWDELTAEQRESAVIPSADRNKKESSR